MRIYLSALVAAVLILPGCGGDRSSPPAVSQEANSAPSESPMSTVKASAEVVPTLEESIAARITRTGTDFQYTADGVVKPSKNLITVNYHHIKACDTGNTFDQEWEAVFNVVSKTWTDKTRVLSNCFNMRDTTWIPSTDDPNPFEISEASGQITIRADAIDTDGTLIRDGALVVTYEQGNDQSFISVPIAPADKAEMSDAQTAPAEVIPGANQIGTLTASSPTARINLRDEPNAGTPTKRYGLVGDRVILQDGTSGSDGYTWYKVQFQGSGAIGWIRADFVAF